MKVILFYLNGCPYCKQAKKVLEELYLINPEYLSVEIEWIEEMENLEISDKYDYQAVPCIYVNDQLMYQAHIGETYDECKGKIKDVLDYVLANK